MCNVRILFKIFGLSLEMEGKNGEENGGWGRKANRVGRKVLQENPSELYNCVVRCQSIKSTVKQ